MKIEFILYPLLLVTISIIVYYYIRKGIQDSEEDSVIDAMKHIAQSMTSGDSFETAMTKVDCKYFNHIIKLTNNGVELDKAMIRAAGKNKTLLYISEVLSLTFTSKGNIVNSLNRLSNKLWEINHLQKKIDSKASSAIATLQVMGIVLMPAIFYFLAGILSSEDLIIEVDLIMQGYLGILMLTFTMLNYFVFKDYKGSIIILPFSIVLYITYLLLLGPIIYGVFI
ncbi:MAG: type II secretion system F family protein [Candidatus Woesearchaeota archaeon]